MKAKLYREFNGDYGLTRNKPIRARLEGTDTETYYVPAGDPVGFRHMCQAATDALSGGSCKLKKMAAPIDVEAFIIPADRMTDELRKLIAIAQS